MSLDYVVFCRARPRFASGYHEIGPIAVNGPDEVVVRDDSGNEDDDPEGTDDWALAQIPDDEREHAGRWRVYLNCGASAAEHADELGALIAAHSGGGWVVCDRGDEGTEVEPAG